MSRPRVGFIIQRYGPEVLGGAEAICRAIARHLSAHWTIEVLTTCAVDHMTWANALPTGTSDVDGVTVRRFAVDYPRNIRRFNRQNERILMRFHSFEDERRWMALQGPHSSALHDYLAARARDYDGFVLFNYLYATTYESLGQVGKRFYLVPFAHDEPQIHLRLFEDVFRSPRGIAFCTEEERDFVRTRFPFSLPPSEVIGVGLDPPAEADGERFRAKFDVGEPFMLYAGRIDESKGCDELLEDFADYRRRYGSGGALALVLAGSGRMKIPQCDGIHHVGVIRGQDKWDAAAAARFLVLPSHFESLSLVLLEAWATGTPVLVNSHCAVSVGQCRRSAGGTWYRNSDEFCAAADWLARDDDLCARLGRCGREFVHRHYRWQTIVERYVEFVRFDR